MNINQVFPSKFLSAADLDGGERTATVRDCIVEEVGQEGDRRPILYFEEFDKGLTLNKTNATTLSQLFGPETDDWQGNRVTIYTIMTEYQGKPTQGLRVRAARVSRDAPRQTAQPRAESYAKASGAMPDAAMREFAPVADYPE